MATTQPEQTYPTPAIGVGGLVFNQEGEVLLVARKNPPRVGEWHIPGGRLEPGETISDCCRREVYEETGIWVTPEKIVAVADRRIDGFHYVIIDFLARLDQNSPQEPNPGSDALEAGWFSIDKDLHLPLVDGLIEVIAAGKRINAGEASGLGLDSRHHWLYA